MSTQEVPIQSNSPEDETENGTILKVTNLWKIFGPHAKDLHKDEKKSSLSKDELLDTTGHVLALRKIDIQVKMGEFFVIMGLSGSGKSTLIRTILRLIDPTSGEIYIDNEDICKFNNEKLIQFRRKKIAMVFQHFGLLPHKTVLDNAAFGLKVQGLKKAERYRRAYDALDTVGLKGWEDYYPGALSGGMQQRVGIARALTTDPEILLMDEPFSGLDPLIRREMQDELVDLQDRVHKTIIFVTHDLHEALKLGDRIAIMRNGEIIQIGTPEDIITSPADDYVKEFVKDASPAKVLTAGSIMEDPGILLYRWEGPQTARHILKSNRSEWAFVVNKQRKFLGAVTLDVIDASLKEGIRDLQHMVDQDIPTCTAEMTMEELFPLATQSRYPIPVLGENDRFLGEVRTRRIFDKMVQEEEEEAESNV